MLLSLGCEFFPLQHLLWAGIPPIHFLQVGENGALFLLAKSLAVSSEEHVFQGPLVAVIACHVGVYE